MKTSERNFSEKREKRLAKMSSAAVRALSLEYKSLLSDPVEGFRVKLIKDDNLFEWEVGLFGPPTTLYEGGYFKVSDRSFVFALNLESPPKSRCFAFVLPSFRFHRVRSLLDSLFTLVYVLLD